MAGEHRRRGGKGLLAFLVVLALVGGGIFAYRWATGAPEGPSRPVAFEVRQGWTLSRIADELVAADVIRSSIGFRVAARGVEDEIQAGDYELRTNMTPGQVLAVLRAGPIIETVSLTVPEGLELREVAGVVAEDLGLDAKRFEEAATSGEFSLPPYLPEGTDTVEGFLFPKTYELSPEVTEEDVITRLLTQFEEEAAGLDWGNAKQLGLSPYEVVVVASLIEREARVAEDRTKISAVIHNRLREGMPLQIDATVQYALPEENRELTFEDYEYDSPYNTYLHAGLPPTPIASPGAASLDAALNPADEDYLYFVVVDPESGAHEFAETYEEFLRLKEQAGLD